MKRFIVLALATLISGQTMASNFTCETQYDAQIKKYEKANYSGVIPSVQIGGSFAVPVGLSIAGAATLAVLPVGVAIGVSMFARNYWLEKKIGSFQMAEAVILEAVLGREEILRKAEELFLSLELMVAKDFLKRINERRAQIGLPEIKLEDYLLENPLPAFNPNSVKFATDDLVKKMNMKEPGKYTFESVSQTVKELAEGDALCPGGKVKGIKQMTNMIKEQL